jgi:hypothetical protein
MRQDEQLNELFRNGFEPDFSEEIPSEFLSDINARLDQLEKSRKKKRPVAIWWVSGIFSLIGVFVFAYSFSPKGNVSQEIAVNRKTSTSPKTSNSTTKEKTSSEVGSIAQNTNLHDHNLKSTTQNQPEIELNNITNTKTGKHKIQAANLGITNDGGENQEQQQDKVKLSRIFSDKKETLEESNILQTDSNNLLANTGSIQTDSATDSDTDEIGKSIENVDSSYHIVVKNDSTNVSSKPENFILKNLSQENTDKKLNYYFGFYSGVSGILHGVNSPSSSVTQTTTFSTDLYREKRKLEEKSITSWDMGAHFGIEHKHWTFTSGIDYFTWGERTNYSNVSYDAQFKNTYQFVNIPALVGYQIQKGSYGIQPNFGISMGLLAKEVSGYYLNIDNSSSSYQANISKITSTLHAGIEFSYISQSGVKVSLNPIFRKSLMSVIQSELVRNSYASIGLQLGIGYRW